MIFLNYQLDAIYYWKTCMIVKIGALILVENLTELKKIVIILKPLCRAFAAIRI